APLWTLPRLLRPAPYPLSLHDALPISGGTRATRSTTCKTSPTSTTRSWNGRRPPVCTGATSPTARSTCTARTWPHSASSRRTPRSEEHTSELQSRFDLVCRLLLATKHH